MKLFTFKMFDLRNFTVFYHNCFAVEEGIARIATRALFPNAAIIG